MTGRHARTGVLSALIAIAAGCGLLNGEPPAEPADADSTCCSERPGEWSLQYLGVGGWVLRYAGSTLLTAPFFSNPGILDVAFGRIEPDTALIDQHLPPVDDARAILVGHGHYDHLMDIPYIARAHAPEARIYASRTAVHTLMGDPGLSPDRLVDLEGAAGDFETRGEWTLLEGGRIRFMALRSGHAPHYMNYTFYSGERPDPLETLPDRASGWLEGQTFAFLIDLLDTDGEPVYRIHYQDAAANPPDGFPPPLPDRKPVDLMILCVPGAEEVDGYPEAIVGHLAPRTAVLGHWEDFFRSPNQELRVSPGADPDAFIRRLERALPEGSTWVLPEPGERIGPAA